MKEKQLSFTEKVSGALARELELPNLFTETIVQLSLTDGIRVCGIEEIKEYTSQKMVFRMRRNSFVIDGEDLQIDCCENGMAIVHGHILSLSFTDGGAFVC